MLNSEYADDKYKLLCCLQGSNINRSSSVMVLLLLVVVVSIVVVVVISLTTMITQSIKRGLLNDTES